MEDISNDMCAYQRNELDSQNYRLVMSTFFSAAAVVTTVLNFLILISIWKTPSLHKPSYILISLALSDLLVGAIGEPLMVIHNIAALKGWSLKVFCQVSKCARGVSYALGAISLSTLTFISLDRLLAVKLMNRYQSVVTQNRVFFLLLSSWFMSCVVSGTLMGYLNLNSHNLKALLLFVGMTIFIKIVTITVCYSMAFCSLRKITSSSSVSPSVPNAEAAARPSSNIDVAKYRKSLITMVILFILTLFVYAPYVCVLISAGFLKYKSSLSSTSPWTPEDLISIWVAVAELIALLNSAMNPLLYLWRIRVIREAVKTNFKTILMII